ncbi:hypothetical protein SAMN04488078_10101 [Antarctobacter heliothermus]|uniref:Uncharacterized protein n=1 Tax=Antarctobacter heliothermus TaxID=74033 RepID=A0A239DAD4_9RHOB|nr:hypothetical protein SAMN04488078_10101 [Antarctobacter heliothermus]
MDRGQLDAESSGAYIAMLQTAPGYVAQALDHEDDYKRVAEEIGAKVGDALRGGISWRCSDAAILC